MKTGFLLLVCAALLINACSSLRPGEGPGMITTFASTMDGRSAKLLAVTLPSGKSATSPFTVNGSKRPGWQGRGSTMGIAGDTRALPEWLDFSWKEPPYPSRDPKSFATDDDYSEYVANKSRDLEVKTQRVYVSSRVPPEVVQEVIESRANIPKGKTLPDKMLWVTFVWTDEGIKFRWRMSCSKPCVDKEGGDTID